MRAVDYEQASMLIEAAGRRILTDPWLSEDAYSGECATVPAYCLRRVRIESVDEQVVRLEWDARPVRHEKSNAATNR